MAGVDDGFAVLASRYGDFDVKDLSAQLARELRQPRVDIAMRLRRSPGIPFAGLGWDDASRIAGALTELGLPARPAPEANLPGVPRPVRVEGAQLDEDELRLRLPGGTWVGAGWGEDGTELLAAVVLLEQAAVVAVDDEEPAEAREDDAIAELAASYKRSHAGTDWQAAARQRVQDYLQRGGVPSQRLEVHLDLALTTGELYRVSSSTCEFRCLGDEVASSSLTNIGRLAGRLDARFAAGVARSAGWLALVAGELAKAACGRLEEHTDWLRWRLADLEAARHETVVPPAISPAGEEEE